MNEDAEITSILEDAKTVAVVGLAADPSAASYHVAEYLQQQGYRVIPVNPTAEGSEILGEKVYASVADIPERVDVVDVFRRSDRTDAPIDDAIAANAKTVWLQLGIRNDEGIERARKAGLRAVQDHCMRIEHGKRHGRAD